MAGFPSTGTGPTTFRDLCPGQTPRSTTSDLANQPFLRSRYVFPFLPIFHHSSSDCTFLQHAKTSTASPPRLPHRTLTFLCSLNGRATLGFHHLQTVGSPTHFPHTCAPAILHHTAPSHTTYLQCLPSTPHTTLPSPSQQPPCSLPSCACGIPWLSPLWPSSSICTQPHSPSASFLP